VTPVAVITGASAGIGADLARVFAANGHALALVARRAQRLRDLADEIAAAGRPRPLVLPLDLAARDASSALRKALADHGCEPQYIVNNAGFGLIGRAAELDRAQQLEMIDLNARALLDLSLAFVDSLERHRGGILNVGSMAGFMPGPHMAVYYASKAYVRSLTDSLRKELGRRGIRVTNVAPGPVPTEFGKRAGTRSDTAPALLTQSAERVAELGYRGLMQGRGLVVPGVANRIAIALIRFVPRRLVAAAVERRQAQRKAA